MEATRGNSVLPHDFALERLCECYNRKDLYECWQNDTLGDADESSRREAYRRVYTKLGRVMC